MRYKITAVLLICILLLTGCGAGEPATEAPPAETTEETAAETTAETAPETTEEEADIAEEKQIVLYFANWYLDTKTAQEGAEVCSIPWDKVTYVNHAFWQVEPADGSEETSFQRREAGKEPRTAFRISSTLPEADFEDESPSTMVPELPRNHFAQYAVYSEKYPEVNILISIGGWTRCGYFSEMAYTPEGRASFVQSCMELLEKYPWIDGFDIDWEYFGGSKDGERKPEDENDQGCPIWGTVEEDSVNFGLLAKELRQAMEDRYGVGVKKLTACASGSSAWTLPMQNWREPGPSMDLINIMTYDMAGMWDHVTGHASRVLHCKDAVTVMYRGHKQPHKKLCIGTPMYGTDFKMLQEPGERGPVGTLIEPTPPAEEEITQEMLRGWEAEAVSGYKTEVVDGKLTLGETFDKGGRGWHCGFDKLNQGAYIYNDDPDSPYYLWYISYETPLTLQAKLDFIHETGIAGIIVWESSQDTYDHQMVSQMAESLLK